MDLTSFYLAIDGGGSKTTVWIADGTGVVIGKATGGPMSLAVGGPDQAVQNLLRSVTLAVKACEQSINSFEKVVIGLAGVDTPNEVANAQFLFKQALEQEYSFTDFQLLNDIMIALESGTSHPNAVALISGTGSNCWGRSENGETARTGGMDFLLSDQGSGYDIGQKVLRAAVKSFDGRGVKTLMEDLVCKHFEIDAIDELKNKVYHPILNKSEIAQLARICFTAHEQQDTAANEIINIALEELYLMVATVLRHLELTDQTTDLVLVGGIARDPVIAKHLEMRLRANYAKLSVIIPDQPPVAGALKLAIKKPKAKPYPTF